MLILHLTIGLVVLPHGGCLATRRPTEFCTFVLRQVQRPAMRMSCDTVTVMINGLSGAMGQEIAAASLRRGLKLAPFGLASKSEEVSVDDGVGGEPQRVELYGSDRREELAQQALACYPTFGSLICIDFTHPSCVNTNCQWYASHRLPFVMGTTGGDREELERTVQAVSLPCVIAPNMAKQIVALQAALESMALEFPNSFSGYKLSVTESHQSTKADTSGTAKAISAHLARLTGESDFSIEHIERVREPAQQLTGGGPSHLGVSPVPEAAIGGHAFHTYCMTSGDGKVEFQVRHNVQGRTTYAEGTVDAALFLVKQIASGASPQTYTMIDVLRSGAM